GPPARAGAHHGRRAAAGGRRDRRATEPGARSLDLPRAHEGLVVARPRGPADPRPGGRCGVRRAAARAAGRTRAPQGGRPAPVHARVRARRGRRVRGAVPTGAGAGTRRRRPGVATMLVRNWMHPDPMTIASDTLVSEAKRLISDDNLHALPVV